MIPGWLERYIGIPYEVCDCYGLVQRFYQDYFHIALPDLRIGPRGTTRAMIEAVSCWQEVISPEVRLGDVIAVTEGRWVRHVGLVVAPGYMLHSEAGCDSVIESYAGLAYQSRIAGCYRYADATAGPVPPGPDL